MKSSAKLRKEMKTGKQSGVAFQVGLQIKSREYRIKLNYLYMQ
jgi:hypothetical protein